MCACVSVLQDLAVEAMFPRSAICRLNSNDETEIKKSIGSLKDGSAYHRDSGLFLPSGSRAEGLALEDKWGHIPTDHDEMELRGGHMGVYIPEGDGAPGDSFLIFRPEECPSAYTKLEISDLDSLKEKEYWYHDNCAVASGGRHWLNTYNTVRRWKDSEAVSGPAAQYGPRDSVSTLVCSGPHTDFKKNFGQRSRGQWPTECLINYIMQLPILLVLVGHKLSQEYSIQARISWSHHEYELIHGLSDTVRQGYIACKYVLKCFLAVHRGQGVGGDGRSRVGSYHLKTVFLYFLEKRSPSLITSPFKLFLDLLIELDEYLQVGKLPHFFLAQCDLLETVEEDERCIAHQAISDILSDPLKAILTSLTDPKTIYVDVRQEDLVDAFHNLSAHPKCEHSRKNLFWLLFYLDKRRHNCFIDQEKRDSETDIRVYGRTKLIPLVDMLKQIKRI